MGIFSKFKEIAGIEDFDEDDLEAELEEQKKAGLIPEDKTPDLRPVNITPAAPRPAAPAPAPAASKPESRNTAKLTSQLRMIVIEPQSFEDCPHLVDNLKTRKPVIINLENLDTDVARKIFDFLSGATYALNGNVQKVANNIFVFAPENINIDYNMNKKQAEAEEGIKSPWSK